MRDWIFEFHGWDPADQPRREALCTLGNGYLGTRGAAEEAAPGGIHYPGTYLAGGYDRLTSSLDGHVVDTEELVNWPNWLPLSFRPRGGEWLDLEAMEVLAYEQSLDLRRGRLERRFDVRDADGRETSLRSRRIVHMAWPHLAAIEWVLTPLNWSGWVTVRSALDGRIVNAGTRRHRRLGGRHLDRLVATTAPPDIVTLAAETSRSRQRVVMAARTLVDGEYGRAARRRSEARAAAAVDWIEVPLEQGRALTVEKTVSVHRCSDQGIFEPHYQAERDARLAPAFEQLSALHERAWERLWRRCDVVLEPAAEVQQILRLNIFHLLQTISLHSGDLDVGAPGRGLSGEGYSGHVFWDELFVFRFLNASLPQLTRALLLYRFRRLREARRQAAVHGYRGAMFPWRSASDGREVSPVFHLNPLSDRWVPDDTQLQRHIGAAIVYNLWQYHESTADHEFLSGQGAELALEIARFWSSIATWNENDQRYSIRGVVGPDEFHTRYPDAHGAGIDDNAYTNVMASWTLYAARQLLDSLQDHRRSELLEELGIDDEELDRWDHVSRRLVVPFGPDGLILQFAGYDALRELDWESYRQRYGPLHRLDHILEDERDDVNAYKASKQPDVLMLFYLFTRDELAGTFGRLGYELTEEMIRRNLEYYAKRTTDGSTLSLMIQSWVNARLRREGSWEEFRSALRADLDDAAQRGTREGLHVGAMAGAIDLVQRCFAGIEVEHGVLVIDPRMPDELEEIRFPLRYHGQWLDLTVTRQEARIRARESCLHGVNVGFAGEVYELERGREKVFALRAEGRKEDAP
jgi:trehalose/maltose hydrolase-like predicted phosphorylase